MHTMSDDQSAYGVGGPLVLGVIWSEFGVVSILILARLHIGLRLNSLSWDFIWAAIATFLGLVSQCVITAAVALAKDIVLSGPDSGDPSKVAMLSFVSTEFVILAFPTAKIAVVALLLRIQNRTTSDERRKIWILYAVIITNIIFSLVAFGVALYQCTHPAENWDLRKPDACWENKNLIRIACIQGIWSGFTDLIFALYPILIFRKLQISLSHKIGLCMLMGAGVLAAACAAIKTWRIGSLGYSGNHANAMVSLIIWTWTEYWVVIFAGCLPPLRTVFTCSRRRRSSAFHKSRPRTERVATPEPNLRSAANAHGYLTSKHYIPDATMLSELEPDAETLRSLPGSAEKKTSL